MNNLITALDIDNNKISIEKQIDSDVIEYNRIRLKSRLKDEKAKIKITNPDELKIVISKEDQSRIWEELVADNETKKYRLSRVDELKTKKENYYILRNTIQDLNNLNEFSAEIERNQLQTVDKFREYENLLGYSLSKLTLFTKICEIRNKNIDEFISTFKDKSLNFKEDSLQLLINCRDMYKINKSIDDIDLYEMYDMQDNLDMSNKLGKFYLHQFANGEKNKNIVNQFAVKNNIVGQLSTKNIINNKLLGALLLTAVDKKQTTFVSNNSVTCLQSTYTTDDTNEMIYTQRSLGELLLEITNEDLQHLSKEKRQQIYMTYEGSRPSSDEYNKWNGLQIYDIDLKYWNGNIDSLKKEIYTYLVDFHWFLWIVKSASGNGLHIYTKVTPPHHVYTNVRDNEYISKYWYNVNYTTKVSIVYDVLYRIHNDNRTNLRLPENFFNEDSEKFELTNKIVLPDEKHLSNPSKKPVGLDNTVGRITSGIRLTFDDSPLVNNNFLDLHIGLNLCQTIDGYDFNSTINRVLLRKTAINNKFIERINELAIGDLSEIQKEQSSDEIDLSKFIITGNDLNQIKRIPKSQINYQLRYNICNTLAALYGKDGLPMAHILLESEASKNVQEINSFYSSAIRNNKKPSKYGLDVLKKVGIIKAVEPELEQECANIFKNHIKKSIENSIKSTKLNYTLDLKKGEYLSDKMSMLLDPNQKGITHEKINIILSPPGSGKTEFIKKLAKDGKRILLVLPFISVIKNKIETDESIMQMFDCFYGSKNVKDMTYGINAVTTFDKFAKANFEKLSSMFDYIMIDESHLLFTSSYRVAATSQAVRKIKELYFISMNDPFSAKICLFTGTETGETYFFREESNVIRVSKKSLSKSMEFMICDDGLDSQTRMASKAVDLINSGYKIFFPTNKGEIYSERVIGMMEHLLERPIKYGYYKRSNSEQEICNLINNRNTIGDYEIIFCSDYLSVGVDINDKNDFAFFYFGNFSGYEIEQFNSRIRKTNIKSFYYIQTESSDGTTIDSLLEETNLVLKSTQEDVDNFLDDKAIAGAKQEFIAQYDPVVQKIVTPGFSYLKGKIQFNLEEYELCTFENKYTDCMEHPVKIARELAKYGYEIKVSTEYDGLDMAIQEKLKEVGKEAAITEKKKKHELLVGTFIDLVNYSVYKADGIEHNDVLNHIKEHPDLIVENRELEDCFVRIHFEMWSITKIELKSKEAFDSMFKHAIYLCKKYTIKRVMMLVEDYVSDDGILNLKKFKRAINLLRIIDAYDNNSLTEATTRIVEKIYDFIDQFEIDKERRISYETYKATIDEFANTYMDIAGINVKTAYGYDKIKDSIHSLLDDISLKSSSKNGIRFVYSRLPDQDSHHVMNKASIDNMVGRMFNLTNDLLSSNKKGNIRKQHIILTEQKF